MAYAIESPKPFVWVAFCPQLILRHPILSFELCQLNF